MGKWADEDDLFHQEGKCVSQLLANSVAGSVATGRGIRLVSFCPKAEHWGRWVETDIDPMLSQSCAEG